MSRRRHFPAGAFVPLEDVEFLPEATTRDTPESLLIAAEERASVERHELAIAQLAREDKRAGLAYDMTSMDRPLSLAFVAAALRTTPDDARRIVEAAHERYAQIVETLDPRR